MTCFLGKDCKGKGNDQCTVHEWTWRHDESWNYIRIALAVAIGIAILIPIFMWHEEVYVKPTHLILEGYNCKQLAEHVAYKKDHYEYAEHIYEWLCVNEQVKEFGR